MKRSFDQTAQPLTTYTLQHRDTHYGIAAAEEDNFRRHFSPICSPSKRRSSFPHPSIMLAERNTIMSGSFPSFMSVFGSEEPGIYQPMEFEEQRKVDQDAFPFMTAPSANSQPTQQHSKPYNHRGSVSSLFSESTASSPTTTNSTFDSPLVSDNSASSSPESATSLAPSSTFQAAMGPQDTQSSSGLVENKQQRANAAQAQTVQDTTKNVKKLTLDMNLPTIRRPATSHASDVHPLSAPSSPLKEPMKSARKKPTNLTIRTPGYNQVSFPKLSMNVPPTPSNRPALHQYPSSPSLSTLASPRGPPAGGMFLQLPSLNTQSSKHSSTSSNAVSFMANSMPDLREENEYQIPKSQEAPERGYTEGPVCIYDCGVYLYLEPTAAEAREFDTVINVAKEIKNPLKSNTGGEGTVMSVWRAEQPRNRASIVEPQTAVSEYSFRSALEWPQQQKATSPAATTPTQLSFAALFKTPEYLHVRWDHNSEILEDLFPLCTIIESRIAEGKKVLIHCQLGVSRSASLIIAYGLFKNYQANFHSMYTAVKERSRWVGPNMSLIYQLTDFKNKLNRGDYANGGREAKPEWFVMSPDASVTPMATDPISAASALAPAVEPLDVTPHTASSDEKRITPLRLNKALPPVPLFLNAGPQTSTLLSPFVVEGPPPPPPQKTPVTVKRAASRPLPFREKTMNTNMKIPAHKPRDLPGITFAQSSAIMDLAMKDVPSTPSLFSPRVSEFTAIPFGIRGVGDLETPGSRQSKEIPSYFSWLPLRKDGHARTASKDPRSPHQQAESKEIFQSIDNYL